MLDPFSREPVVEFRIAIYTSIFKHCFVSLELYTGVRPIVADFGRMLIRSAVSMRLFVSAHPSSTGKLYSFRDARVNSNLVRDFCCE